MRILFAVVALFLAGVDARAAGEWPVRPISLVHGFGAGGNADTLARVVAEALTQSLQATIVVEARPGAGGISASDFVSRAAPDGYTLILLTGGHAVSAALNTRLRFSPVDSFTFISLVGKFPFVIATRMDGPVKTLEELVATAREKPESLSFSSVGFGSTQHLAGELFAQAADGRLTHIPYKGGMQPVSDVLAGRVDLLVDTITVTGSSIKAGTLRGLGITSAEPWPLLPDVPPIGTVLPDFEVMSWIGLAAPAGLPEQIRSRLTDALSDIARSKAFRLRLEQLGVVAEASSAADMKDFVASEIARWNHVVDKAHIQRQ